MSRRTGVAPDTLRKWEQRYGVLHPDRSPGGQRRYNEGDVARVEWLRDRLREGFRISEAARILGGAQSQPATDANDLPDLIVLALVDLDGDRLVSLLDQTFTVLPLQDALVRVVAPLLRRVGDAWAAGEITIAQEHLLTSKLRCRLERVLADAHGGVRGTAVLACAPGERHDVGLLMLTVLLHADGWRVEYLGADTPAAQALALAEAVEADVVCFSAALAESAATLEEQLAATPHGDRPAIVVGGHAVDDRLAHRVGGRRLDDDLVDAVRRLRTVVA